MHWRNACNKVIDYLTQSFTSYRLQTGFATVECITFLSTVQELASVHALGGDKEFLSGFEFVRISEVYDGQGCATTRVVDDVL